MQVVIYYEWQILFILSPVSDQKLIAKKFIFAYHVAGLRSRTTRLPPGLRLLETRVQSLWDLGLYSTMKKIMGQPPSAHAFRCSVTEPEI